MRKFNRSLAGPFLAFAMLAAACGGDDDDEPGDSAGPGDGTSVAACSGTDLKGSSPGTASFSATTAVAASLNDGRAYTVYIGDFDLSKDDVSGLGSPQVPAGKTLYTVAVTVFNATDPSSVKPVAAGDEIKHTTDFNVRTFAVISQDSTGTHGTSTGASGSLNVEAVGDTFCGTITYTDGEKSITGSFEAPAKGV